MTATTKTAPSPNGTVGADKPGEVQPEESAPEVTVWDHLRKPFPANMTGILPKAKKKDSPKGKCNECGGWHGLPAVHLEYVGHAAVTDRLLAVDPEWKWQPVEREYDPILLGELVKLGSADVVRDYLESCPPKFVMDGDYPVGLWIRLTVNGVTRLGYGTVEKAAFDAEKQLIGDAMRNAAMRFGVALDLWIKGQEDEKTGDVDAEPEPDFGECPRCHEGRLVKRTKRDGETFIACSKNKYRDSTSCQHIVWMPDAQRIIDAGSAHGADEAAHDPDPSVVPAPRHQDASGPTPEQIMTAYVNARHGEREKVTAGTSNPPRNGLSIRDWAADLKAAERKSVLAGLLAIAKAPVDESEIPF